MGKFEVYKGSNDFGNIKFESSLESDFYDFMNNFELTSMVKSIQSQVWVNRRRRVDFVLTLINGEIVYIEVDGPTHENSDVKTKDFNKDNEARGHGIHTIRISCYEFYYNKQVIANRIEGMIELISGI